MLRGQIVYCTRCGHARAFDPDPKSPRHCPRCDPKKNRDPVWTTQPPVDRGLPLVPYALTEADRTWLKRLRICWEPSE